MTPLEKTTGLDFWSRPVIPLPLGGGLTNTNFTVDDNGKRYVVRIGEDIPIHGVMRFNELSAAKAAFMVGVAPEIVYHTKGVLVMSFIEGHTFKEEDVKKGKNLDRILKTVQTYHQEIPNYLEGPVLGFSPFQITKIYISLARKADSRLVDSFSGFLKVNAELERNVGNIKLVFGHNDLLAANFIDDGDKIWLLDWEYAGYSPAIFDLANLSSNNQFSENHDDWIMEKYYQKTVTDEMRLRLRSMKCASLLRETLWSIIQEFHSDLGIDYQKYTEENLDRFNVAYRDLY